MEWKKYFKNRKKRERKDARAKFRVEKQAFDAAMNTVNQAQRQVDEWIQCTDVYTDELFWYNPVTDELTVELPSLEHYLPANYFVPDPPTDLPPGVTLDSTDEEDGAKPVTASKALRSKKSTKLADDAIPGGGGDRASEMDSDSDEEGEHPDGQPAAANEQASWKERSRSKAFRFQSTKTIDEEHFDDGVSAITAQASLHATVDEANIPLKTTEEATAGYPPSLDIRDPKLWKPLPLAASAASAALTSSPVRTETKQMIKGGDSVSSKSTATTATSLDVESVVFSYGPDSLRVGRPGKLVEPYVPPPATVKPAHVMELYNKVDIARKYISQSKFHQIPEMRVNEVLANPGSRRMNE